MRKALNWLGWILFGITFMAAVYFAIPRYIEEIQIDEENECTWITISEITNENSHIKLKVPANDSIKTMTVKKYL